MVLGKIFMIQKLRLNGKQSHLRNQSSREKQYSTFLKKLQVQLTQIHITQNN